MDKVQYTDTVEKSSAEKFAYTLDYSGRTPNSATVSSCAVAAKNLASGATDNTVISGTTATVTTTTAAVFLQAGTSGKQYQVKFTATLSDGSVLVDYVLLIVKDL